MRCDDVRRKLDDYVEQTLQEDEASALEDHLYSCTSCREEHEACEALRELLRTSSQSVSPPESYFQRVFTRVIRRLQAEERPRTSLGHFARSMRGWLSAPGLGFRLTRAAALVLVGLIGGMYLVAYAPAGLQWLTPSVRLTETSQPPTLEIAEPGAEEPAGRATGTLIVRSALERERGISPPGLPEEALAVAIEPERSERAIASVLSERERDGRMTGSGVAVPLKPVAPQPRLDRLLLVSNKIRESEVLEDLANIRLNLYLAGEERYIPEFQKIEGLFYEIIQSDTAEDQNYIEIHKMYQTAEQHLLNRQYFDALKHYYLVAHRQPKSLLAFLARFQIANINFKILHDYKSALLNYEKCLENYPAHFISDEKKDIILSRIELLAKNSQDNWRPLRLYYRARVSSPEVANLLYQEILESYPNSTLVQSCIETLTSFAIGEQYEGTVTPEEIIILFQSYRERWPQNPPRAYVQLGIADILNYRLHNYQQALLEYLHVVNTAPDSEATLVAKKRIRRLYQRGFSTKE